MRKLSISAILALASPIISITTQSDWQQGLDNAGGGGKVVTGSIQPVTTWNNGLEHHYPSMQPQVRTPNLGAMLDLNPSIGGNQEGLLMSWGSAADEDTDIIAGWEYVYDIDPDFSSVVVDIDAHPPCVTISSICIGLKDAFGNIRSWAWNVPAALPCGLTTHVSIVPAAGSSGAAPPASSYYNDPAFDITQVISIEFCENGTWVAAAPPDPGGNGQNVWNYWQNLTVTTVVSTEESSWGSLKSKFDH
jgi:hypothetical protein